MIAGIFVKRIAPRLEVPVPPGNILKKPEGVMDVLVEYLQFWPCDCSGKLCPVGLSAQLIRHKEHALREIEGRGRRV